MEAILHPTHTLLQGLAGPKTFVHARTWNPGTLVGKGLCSRGKGSHFCGCAGPWVRAGFSQLC